MKPQVVTLRRHGALEHGLLLSSLLPPDQRTLPSCRKKRPCLTGTGNPSFEHISLVLDKLAFPFFSFGVAFSILIDSLVCRNGTRPSWTVLGFSPLESVWFSVVLVTLTVALSPTL